MIPEKKRKTEIVRSFASGSLPCHDRVILVDKPAGITSAAVVNAVKRITRQKKAGHSGTLDRFATGLMLVCTGSATRLTRFFLDSDKKYTASVQLGRTTDTLDPEGSVISEASFAGVTLNDVRAAASAFRGEILQSPPIYSALKISGKRASDIVRSGKEVKLAERRITIFSLEILSYDEESGLFEMEVHCSKGTYIRSLAGDIGKALGTGAYVAGLRRTASGEFSVDKALTIDELESGNFNSEAVIEPASALHGFGSVTIDDSTVLRVYNGAFFSREDVISIIPGIKKTYMICDKRKKLVAIADIDVDKWRIEYLNVFSNQRH